MGKKPKRKPAARVNVQTDATPDTGAKFETESHVYNHRTRNNLKQNQRKATRGSAAY